VSSVAHDLSRYDCYKIKAHAATPQAQRLSSHGSSFVAQIDIVAMAICELELE